VEREEEGMSAVTGWLVAALLPVLPGSLPNPQVKVHDTLALCELMEEDLRERGANIVVPCRYTTGQETVVITVRP
jgi:hypothetical protein